MRNTVSRAIHELVKHYTAALQAYLTSPVEALRERAYLLGHEAIASGLGVLDVTAAHQEALLKILEHARTPQDSAQAAQRASEFLLESLVPFEMTHRGYKETIHNLIAANEALRTSEAKNLALLNAMPDTMFRISKEGTYLDFKAWKNDGVVVLPSAVVGKQPSKFLPTHVANQLMVNVEKALDSGTIQVFEYQLLLGDTLHDYEVRLAVSGKDEVLGIVRDVTERKRAEQEHATLIREQAARAEAQTAHERISNILESIADGFMALDEEWRFTYVNQRAEMLLRRKREQLLCSSIWKEFPETVGTTFEKELRRAATEHVTVSLREYYEPLSIWLEARAYPSKHGLSVYFRDITEQRHHERARLGLARVAQQIVASRDADEALAIAAAELVASFDIALARVWLWDQTEQVLALRASAGVSTDEAGDSCFGIFHLGEAEIGTIAAGRRPIWSNTLQSEPGLCGTRWAEEMRMTAFAGFPLVVGNQLLGVMGLFSRRAFDEDDLTALATLADQLSIAIEKGRLLTEIQKALKLREEFIDAAAHELRTPVTVLKGYAGLLRKFHDPSSAAFGKALKIVDISADRIARLAEELIQADALQRGTVSLQTQQFDLANLARQVIAAASEEHPDYQFSLATKPALVLADRDQLGRVIRHLIDNAVKYQPSGGEIDVKVSAVSDQAVLTVQDHGLGISPERQEHMFEPMYEPIPPGRVGYVGVVGLGLMISRRLVELHGGRIWLDSEPGKGSAFHFEIPLATSRGAKKPLKT